MREEYFSTDSSSVNASSDSTNVQSVDIPVDIQPPVDAPCAHPVFFRTYSRVAEGKRETYADNLERTQTGLAKLGKFTKEEAALTRKYQAEFKTLPSGRWMWVGGTPWIEEPVNFSGGYNCTSTKIMDVQDLARLMDLSMCGSGVGWVVEDVTDKFPVLRTITLEVLDEFGALPTVEESSLTKLDTSYVLSVGDSRQGWVAAYKTFLKLYMSETVQEAQIEVTVDLRHVRKAESLIKGFGGRANPSDLAQFFKDVCSYLNTRVGKSLTPTEVTWLACRSLATVVAGNIRRSAGIGQGADSDVEFASAKSGMWTNNNGVWSIDPEKDALRMANLTRVFHHKPTLEEVTQAVATQYHSSEGAIQFAPAAIARGNADILTTAAQQSHFIDAYEEGKTFGGQYLLNRYHSVYGNYPTPEEMEHRMSRYGLNPCFAAGTMVLTRQGHFPIEQLVGKVVDVWDGNQWVAVDNFRVTAEDQEVYKVTLHSGQSVTATAYHTFILEDGTKKELRHLLPGDVLMSQNVRPTGDVHLTAAYLKGFLVGDGSSTATGNTVLHLYRPKYACETRLINSASEIPAETGRGLIPVGFTSENINAGRKEAQGLSVRSEELYPWVSTYRRSLPVDALNWDNQSKYDFIAGVMDADGTASDTKNGFMYQITSIHESWLLSFQLLLLSIGVKSKVALSKVGGDKDFGDRGGVCVCQPLYRLTISQAASVQLAKLVNFERLTSFADKLTAYNLKDRSNKVVSVEFSHVADEVYCCTVYTNHSFTLSNSLLVGQCGEIIGRDFYCNLSEIHLNQLNPLNLAEQEDAFRAGALTVGALLHHNFEDSKFQASRELDPIVGVSFTGLFDFFVNAFGAEWLRWWEAGRPDEYLVEDMDIQIAFAVDLFDLNLPTFERGDYSYWNLGGIFKALEEKYLTYWRLVVEKELQLYCHEHRLKMPNRYTTCQPAGCLDKTAVRIFDQGLLYADELVSPGSGVTDNLALSVRNGVGATSAIANQPLPLVKVVLKNGRILKMTPNHRLSVEGEWVQAADLAPGMPLDFSIGEYRSSSEAALEDIDWSRYTREARQAEVGHSRGVLAQAVHTPSVMSTELAYFLGALFTNGCLSESHYRVRFSHGRVDVLDRLSSIASNLFGVPGTFTSDSRGGRTELCIASKPLYDWLIQNKIAKLDKSLSISRVPLKIRTSSRESILSFFAGMLDCDGCPRNGTFSIDLASEDFIRNLQQVGEAVGLALGISHNTKGTNFQGTKSIWTVHLSRVFSQPESCEWLNKHSIKLAERPIEAPRHIQNHKPFNVVSVQIGETVDYSYDFAVDGVDDDDSWYYQGAIKSHNTKSLLTGASSGWHPPKAQRFIRRITFQAHHPVALACIDYGYTVIPSQSCKDESGALLDDPFDPRVTEWLVEIPVEVPWANLPGADSVIIENFSALAQYDFYMQVQNHYTTHNTSATIELRENEIEELSNAIYNTIQENGSYISTALQARFDAPFPRLPFEKIDKLTFDALQSEVIKRRKVSDFHVALMNHDKGWSTEESPAGCDSDKCLLPLKAPSK